MITMEEKQTITIRQGTLDDLARLTEMYAAFEPKAAFQGLPPSAEEKIKAWLEDLLESGNNSHFVVETPDGVITGHGMLCRSGAETAEVAVFLHQDYRSLGLGRQLVQAAVNCGCQCLHLKRIWLTVGTLNARAIGLFRKSGFVHSLEAEDVPSELLMERGVSCHVCRKQECPVYDKRVPISLTLSDM